MKKFTVIGYYPDNNQPWAASSEGEDWREAAQNCRKDISDGCTVRVCGVIEGDHLCVDNMDETIELESMNDELESD